MPSATRTDLRAVDGERSAAALAAMSDDVLIAHATCTEPPQQWAFAELWSRHHGYVRAFCTRRLGNSAEAEDVSQNVAVKAYFALGKFERRARVRTWLTAIALTQCADFQRREARQKDIARRVFAEQLPMWDSAVESDASTQPTQDRALMTRTRRALSSLPLQSREAIEMRYFRDLSLEDMSSELGIGLSGAKMRLYRSVERLRDRYFELESGDPGHKTNDTANHHI